MRKLPPQTDSGFTLVEVTLVMAITSTLLVLALIGYSSLIKRQRFDTAIAKTLQDLSYVRQFAISNINDTGHGTSKASLLVGASMEYQNQHLDNDHPLAEMEPIFAAEDSGGQPDYSTLSEIPLGSDAGLCNPAASDDGDECWERYFPTNDNLTLASPNQTIIVIYVNTNNGLEVCHELSGGGVTLFDACADTAGATFTFDITGSSGLTATIEVNGKSGIARRVK
jgi:prepilin-type N-terminal cleavage/methylation domain-containing protein